MLRPLVTFAAFFLGVAFLGGTAEARRAVCELEPLVSLAEAVPRVDDAAAAPERPVVPAESRQCRPGLGADPACFKEPPLPDGGRRLSLDFDPTFALRAGAPVLPRPDARAPSFGDDVRPLADGFARRLERPPRSPSVVS